MMEVGTLHEKQIEMMKLVIMGRSRSRRGSIHLGCALSTENRPVKGTQKLVLHRGHTVSKWRRKRRRKRHRKRPRKRRGAGKSLILAELIVSINSYSDLLLLFIKGSNMYEML